MPRSNSLTNTDLSARSIRLIDLIKIELPAGTITATNYESDISLLSDDGSTIDTYYTGKGYIAHNSISQTGQVMNSTVELYFDSIALDSTQNSIGLEFANGNYTGAPVTIKKGLVKDPFTDTVYFTVWKGVVDNFSINLKDTTSKMTITVGGPFANFDKTPLYGYTNTASQSMLYEDDKGFQYSQRPVSNLRWEE
jgi:hypothetical protein|tara:strand:- start:8295 stop:8879 length:585 start_codon:yes stop_codon:yes gene_type:complete